MDDNAIREDIPIRRSKLKKAALLAGAVATLAMIALVSVAAWRIMHMRPASQTDFLARANQLMLDSQPAGENAWPFYGAILRKRMGAQASATEELAEVVNSQSYFELICGAWDDERHQEPKRMHEELRSLLPEIHDATRHPGLYSPLLTPGGAAGASSDGELMNAIFEHQLAGALRPICRILGVDMRRAANESDWDAFIENFDSLVRISDQVRLTCTMLGAHESLGILRFGLDEIKNAVFEHELPSEVNDRLMQSLMNARLDADDFQPTLEMSRLESLDLVQWLYTIGNPIKILVINLSTTGVIGSHGASERRINSAFDQTVEWWSLPPAERNLKPTGLEVVEEEPLIGALMMDSEMVERFRRRIDIVNLELEAVQVLLRMEMYVHEHGVWPNTLDEIASEHQQVLGAAFRYSPTPSLDGLPITLDWPDEWRRWVRAELISARQLISEPVEWDD